MISHQYQNLDLVSKNQLRPQFFHFQEACLKPNLEICNKLQKIGIDTRYFPKDNVIKIQIQILKFKNT